MGNRILNMLFGTLLLIGHLGEVIWIPQWIDTMESAVYEKNCSSTIHRIQGNGSYFMVMSTTFFELLLSTFLYFVFGCEKKFKITIYLVLLSIIAAISSVFTPYVGESSRNEPIIQAFLLNFSVPITVLVRLLWFKKLPCIKKTISVIVVIVGVGIASFPTLFPCVVENCSEDYMNKNSSFSVLAQSFWIISYIILSVIPDIFTNIFGEKLFNSSSNRSSLIALEVNLSETNDPIRSEKMIKKEIDFYCVSLFMIMVQFLGVFAFAWVDFIPHFGHSKSPSQFMLNLKIGFLCTIGKLNCPPQTIGYAIASLVSIYFAHFFSLFLLKNGEESLYLAIIMNFVTPCSVIFWLLFTSDSSTIKWSPHFKKVNIFSIVAGVIILPSTIIYSCSQQEYSVRWKKTNIKICSHHIWWFEIVK